MVEVTTNVTLLAEEKQALAPSMRSAVPTSCQPADVDRSDYSDTRWMAASKRSILKTRNRSLSGGTRTSPSGFPQRPESEITPTITVVPTADDIKRLRPDCNGTGLRDAFKSRALRRIRNHSVPTQLESSFAKDCASLSSSEVVCKTSLLSKPRLQNLLSMELAYHPNNAFLYYVDPVVEDKVDATLRNEAVHGLRCIHNAFFTLSAEVFCKAVNLIDRFVVKVKVCERVLYYSPQAVTRLGI
ncbi:unnamed protein product [Dibothriocephalus latus]|uniref:Cyclin N-terminal domain-containing protein n=1 Tax=Dibothriocephalus latus TaxID=60516 RepID=A0A3P7NTN0_DIBLA|nr:unnamed protein product [Dibothriocephalus latus]